MGANYYIDFAHLLPLLDCEGAEPFSLRTPIGTTLALSPQNQTHVHLL